MALARGITPVWLDRREARYSLRASLRKVSSLKRLRSCGLPLNSSIVAVERDGRHYFTGMSTCASGFACPVCAAKIRYHRALEVSRAIVSAIDKGMYCLFVTRTLPHSAEDRLGTTFNLFNESRRFVANQTKVKEARAQAGYLGSVASKEITYGTSGWHPHSHDLELFEEELTLRDFATLSRVYYEYLNRFYVQNGFLGLSMQHGVRIEQVDMGRTALANYVSKLQEHTAIQLSTGNELTRWDLKQGRTGSLMPFDVAQGFFETGDMALLELWHEYERATFYKNVIRFTEGLRERLIPGKALTDKQLAELKTGGKGVVRFADWFYRKITRVPGLEGKVLTTLDTGGFAALVELLTVYHLDDPGGYYEIAPASDE